MARARVSTGDETCERVVIDAGVLQAHLKTSGRWSYSTCVPHVESRHLVAAQQGTVLRLSTPSTASSVMRTATTKMADTSYKNTPECRRHSPSPRSTSHSFFSVALPCCPKRKFSGFTSPCTYLRSTERQPAMCQQRFSMCATMQVPVT